MLIVNAIIGYKDSEFFYFFQIKQQEKRSKSFELLCEDARINCFLLFSWYFLINLNKVGL